VAARTVRDSDLKGGHESRTPYRDLASDGGVLVGLEVGLAGPPAAERVVAVRPIYRIDGRLRNGPPAGSFLADEVRRTVRLAARDGYAVAAVRVRAGWQVDGLGLRFARVDGARLRPADADDSDWVGAAKADSAEWLDGGGRPVVGLFARLDGDAVRGLGLTFADLPEPAAAPAGPAASAPPPAAARPRRLALEIEAPGPPKPRSRLPYVVVGVSILAPLALVAYLAFRRDSVGLRQLRGRSTVQNLPPARRLPDVPQPEGGSVMDVLERGDPWR
jgi:hypothetical protein